jgi:hypothetical protein
MGMQAFRSTVMLQALPLELDLAGRALAVHSDFFSRVEHGYSGGRDDNFHSELRLPVGDFFVQIRIGEGLVDETLLIVTGGVVDHLARVVVAVETIVESALDRVQVAPLMAALEGALAKLRFQNIVKAIVPLGVHLRVMDPPRILGKVLGDQVDLRVCLASRPGKETDTVRDIRLDVGRRVVPEAIHVVLAQPVVLHIPDKRLGYVGEVIEVRHAPGIGTRKVRVLIVRPEAVQRAILLRVIKHHVQDHRYAALVRLVNEAFQVVRVPIGAFGGKEERGVVSPGAVHRKLRDRHQFDRRDS